MQVDLQTNVSLSCEGIIIEDEAQKILLLSKVILQSQMYLNLS